MHTASKNLTIFVLVLFQAFVRSGAMLHKFLWYRHIGGLWKVHQFIALHILSFCFLRLGDLNKHTAIFWWINDLLSLCIRFSTGERQWAALVFRVERVRRRSISDFTLGNCYALLVVEALLLDNPLIGISVFALFFILFLLTNHADLTLFDRKWSFNRKNRLDPGW